ncbi:MAG: TonB-dependent receptor [Acidobacteria bacterium]|nr:TonB-dependent receptor [Acidobacteriota bacterium]
MRTRILVLCTALAVWAAPALAATVTGVVTDGTGAPLPDTRVVLRSVTTGQEIDGQTGPDGRYSLEVPGAGDYLVLVLRASFSESARTITIDSDDQTVDVPVQLELGSFASTVSVTAARAEREIKRIPLHVETMGAASIEQSNPLSTGDALAEAANVTQVGNGPFGVRPRLRGLDSTRMLVLVDGERLNTARQATDRTGAEVGLIPTDSISRIEIVNGAGTLLYGSDALAGTVNIVTNEPTFTPTLRWVYGLNSYYSSNEDGRRGSLTFGATAPRYAFRVQAGAEDYGNYKAGKLDVEDTRPFFTSGQLDRADTVDDNFGFAFGAFPDPFNAPYVRTDNTVLNSQATGNFVNATALFKLGENRRVRARYQRRRVEDVGFGDFADPYFFNATTLPKSNLDKMSVRYEAQAVTPWLANLSLTAYYQRTERLLRTNLPVQFPAPTAVSFFPITVFRLDILSETEQRVWTPGIDLQAVITPATNHVLTTGATFYRDRSSDDRFTSTTTSMVGQVALGARGPAPVVFPAPVVLGPATIGRPVRVPDAALRDIAVFAQDEWRVAPRLSVIGGLRGDFYNVTTKNTPGYDVGPVVAGAVPAIDPNTLPNAGGESITRNALTGDIGVVANPGGAVNPFIRFGRSYRHPNLEEMLFAGPATAGSIAPNVKVKPEIGNNFDIGAKFAVGRITGGAYGFVNRYKNFIAQDLVVATTPAGPLAQAINFADVRIQGVEMSLDAPIVTSRGVLALSGSSAFTRGTVTKGEGPGGVDISDSPADNITPVKVVAAARFTESSGRVWLEYGVRTQPKVSRVATTLLDSPFLIAQDLLSLDGFTVQRVAWGVNLTRGRDRVGLTFAIENLTNNYYREHFQVAPARGRSFTVGLNLGSF